MADIYVGDYGTVFEVTVMEGASVVDLSATSSVDFIVYRPVDRKAFERTGQFKTNGTDGRVIMTIQKDDFFMPGIWKVQLRITFPYGCWRTSLNEFTVKA